MSTLTTMLARPYTYTSLGAGNDGRVRATGGTWRGVTVASGTYRTCLAPTTGTAVDLLRVVQTALNAALVPDGITMTVTLDANGRVAATATAAVDCELDGVLSRLLGNGYGAVSNKTSWTSVYHPQHCAFTWSFTGPEKEMVRSGGWEVTAAGRVYGFSAGAASWRWPVRFGFLPRTSSDAPAGNYVSPAYPTSAYLSSLGEVIASREWSWADIVHDEGSNSGAVPCALAQSNYQAIRSSTSERFWLVQIDPESLSPKPVAQDPAWPRWHHLDLVLRLPSSGASGTRA